ncbi:MAG: GAF domain-containing protein [Chloroflexi bacterium]|nr:GAF domain-containing protein [Ktedonobacteraceae bacterium]MBV9706427.1 GAF domain-containing protein [Chloroflexota bacterium]
MTTFEDRRKDTHEAQTWRELLGIVIRDPRERQRIAEELGIRTITLGRWVSGESDPRSQNLRRLLEVVPQYREQLLDLIREEEGFEEFAEKTQHDPSKEIHTEFYERILIALATSASHLRFWSICNLVLQQAMGQLDPERLGIVMWVICCMPPSGPHNKVRSLREIIGRGTPPWGGNLEQKGVFLGAESLAGNVVALLRPAIIENLDEEYSLPATRMENEKSAAVYPILYAGRIAGVFLISSTQYNYFLPQFRSSLAQGYADLLALALDPEKFYAPKDIALCMIRSEQEQKKLFVNFRQRVANSMIEASRRGEYLNNLQADELVWRQLEEELLQEDIS